MSKLPFELLLALRYLRPKRTFVSIITLISILGVALGVAVLIIVISVMSGFDHDLRAKILGFNAHLKVFALDKSGMSATMENYPQVMKLVASNKNVRGVAPFVLGQVLVETEPAGTNTQAALTAAPWLRGVDVNTENSVSVLPKSIIAGETNLTAALSGQSVIVGSDFADSMKLSVGDRLSISSPSDLKKMRDNYGKPGAEVILPDDYTVTGIFDVGYFEYDANVIVTSLENAQDLYNLGDSVHGLMVMLNDPYQADKVRSELLTNARPRFQHHDLDGGKFRDSRRACRGKKRHVLPAVFHRARRGALHLERANHVRRPENARDRDAQGAGRDTSCKSPEFFFSRAPSSASSACCLAWGWEFSR